MQELNAKAETERAAAEDKMTVMAAEVAKLRVPRAPRPRNRIKKATEAATAAGRRRYGDYGDGDGHQRAGPTPAGGVGGEARIARDVNGTCRRRGLRLVG